MTDRVEPRTKRRIFAGFLIAFTLAVVAMSYAASASPEREIEITRTTCDLTCSESYTFVKEETVLSDVFYALMPLTVLLFFGVVVSAVIAVDP